MGALKKPSIQRLHDIFDFSPETLAKRPDVPQSELERMPDAARGIPEHVKKLGAKRNLDRMDSYAKAGDDRGARGWYNTEQLKQYFQAELGGDEGTQAFEKFIGMVAASSPQTKTPLNTKIASRFYMLDRQGEKISPGDPIPPGYGHYVQKTAHQPNARTIQEIGWLDSKKNPKIESFRNNLLGNYEPLTADIHNSRALGLKTAGGKPADVPETTHYGFIERMQKQRAEQLGMRPAEYQANAWVGAGEKTNLGSPPDPFLKVFEDRVGLTSNEMGLPKHEVLRRVIRGEIPLRSVVNPQAITSRMQERDQELKNLGMPEFSKPQTDSVYKPIDMPLDRDVGLEDLPEGFAITEEGVRDPQGLPAKFRSPSAGQLLSKLGTDILPAAGGTLPKLARGAIVGANGVDKLSGGF